MTFQKICDCTTTALGGCSLIGSAISLGSSGEIPLKIGVGIGVILMAYIIAKLADTAFDLFGWQESTARSITKWTFVALSTSILSGTALAAIGAATSIAQGILLAVSNATMIMGSIFGPTLIIISFLNLVDANYVPSSWNEISNRRF